MCPYLRLLLPQLGLFSPGADWRLVLPIKSRQRELAALLIGQGLFPNRRRDD
jgi:hypothetical protein